jgi:hypothetical protein
MKANDKCSKINAFGIPFLHADWDTCGSCAGFIRLTILIGEFKYLYPLSLEEIGEWEDTGLIWEDMVKDIARSMLRGMYLKIDKRYFSVKGE